MDFSKSIFGVFALGFLHHSIFLWQIIRKGSLAVPLQVEVSLHVTGREL